MSATLPVTVAPNPQVAGGIRVEIVNDFDVLRSFAESWFRLWRDNPSGTIFQSLPWISAWWKAFGKELVLCTPVVYQDSRIVGILPLVRSGNEMRFVGSPGADYCDILCEEGQAPQIIEAALRSLFGMEGWKRCKLTNLRDDSILIRYSRNLPGEILRCLHTQSDTRRSSLVLGEDRNAVIDAVRRKPALRRHRNKLNKTGEVRFCHIEERALIHRYLHTLFQQHIGRRALANQASQFLTPEWREFYHAMVDELNPAHELRFSILELDGRTIACHFGFESKGTLTLYKPAFDVDVGNLSPGDVLLSEMLTYARERKLNEVDFTVGRESYKEHFTNQTRDMYRSVLYRRDWRNGIRRTFRPFRAQIIGSPAMTLLKQAAYRSFEWVRERYQELSAASWLQQIWRPSVICRHIPSPARSGMNAAWSPRPATFSDMTDLAMQYPRLINARSLQNYLARLHRGDRCYVLENSGGVCIGWVQSAIISAASEANGVVKRPVELLYDVLALGETPAESIRMDLLDWFVGNAESNGSLACVRIPRLNVASRKTIKKDGFVRWADARLVSKQQPCNS